MASQKDMIYHNTRLIKTQEDSVWLPGFSFKLGLHTEKCQTWFKQQEQEQCQTWFKQQEQEQCQTWFIQQDSHTGTNDRNSAKHGPHSKTHILEPRTGTVPNIDIKLDVGYTGMRRYQTKTDSKYTWNVECDTLKQLYGFSKVMQWAGLVPW